MDTSNGSKTNGSMLKDYSEYVAHKQKMGYQMGEVNSNELQSLPLQEQV